MKLNTLLATLEEKKIISSEQSALLEEFERHKDFPVHWELRTILYLGIVMLTSGLGVIIYQNIDTIGHQVIIALIGILSAACFRYTYYKRTPFTWHEVESTNKLSEYALLLGCTSFLIMEGYLQFQYKFFGEKYGLAILTPTILFVFCAYFFDHRGVLSMAITGLASWLGLTIAPTALISGNNLGQPDIVITSVLLGLGLIAIGWTTILLKLKSHFAFTYFFLGGNLAAVASMAGLFLFDIKIVYFIVATALCAFFIYYSRQKHALIFLLMGTIYGYILMTYLIFTTFPDTLLALIGILYFMMSSGGVIFFLLNVKKLLGVKDEKGL
jgi:hypothetical protein